MTHRAPIRRAAWTGRRAVGFTLVELLVVMSIIVVLIAIGVPSVTALIESGRLPHAQQTVASAVTVARAAATEGGVPADEGPFRGAAAVLVPRNGDEGQLIGANLHIVRHTRGDRDQPEYEAVENASTLAMPSRTIAVGIFRDGSGNAGLKFHAPPFAVRFNGEGVLIPTPPTPPDPPDHSRFVHYEATGSNNPLPSAIGVVIFELEDFRDAGHQIAEDDVLAGLTDAGQWIRDNGRHAVFNRYAGTVLNQP